MDGTHWIGAKARYSNVLRYKSDNMNDCSLRSRVYWNYINMLMHEYYAIACQNDLCMHSFP